MFLVYKEREFTRCVVLENQLRRFNFPDILHCAVPDDAVVPNEFSAFIPLP